MLGNLLSIRVFEVCDMRVRIPSVALGLKSRKPCKYWVYEIFFLSNLINFMRERCVNGLFS